MHSEKYRYLVDLSVDTLVFIVSTCYFTGMFYLFLSNNGITARGSLLAGLSEYRDHVLCMQSKIPVTYAGVKEKMH